MGEGNYIDLLPSGVGQMNDRNRYLRDPVRGAHVMQEHVLSALYSALDGDHGLADIWVLLPSRFSQMAPGHWVNAVGFVPWHFLRIAVASLARFGYVPARSGGDLTGRKWLFVLHYHFPDADFPNLCEVYSAHFRSKCPVPEEMASSELALVAFPRALLQNLTLPEWELVSSLQMAGNQRAFAFMFALLLHH